MSLIPAATPTLKPLRLWRNSSNGTPTAAIPRQTLAQWMNRQGFRTNARGSDEGSQDPDAINGRRFTGFSIRDILKNPF